jgi:hypothetical protein
MPGGYAPPCPLRPDLLERPHNRAAGSSYGRFSPVVDGHCSHERALRRVHVVRRAVYAHFMSGQRLNITLDGEHAAKLATLAARVHVNEGTLARSLLSSAIDGLDPDPANVAVLLDGIDGAFERAQLGVEQAAAGETVALDEL